MGKVGGIEKMVGMGKVRGQRSEVRSQRSDFRSQKERGRTGWGEGEVRSQKSDVRCQMSEEGGGAEGAVRGRGRKKAIGNSKREEEGRRQRADRLGGREILDFGATDDRIEV
jgi:hypothetical protein